MKEVTSYLISYGEILELKYDWSMIVIPYSKHVRQIFLRSGLAKEDTRDTIVNVAKDETNCPGILDKVSWHIKKDFCLNINPRCTVCPLETVCAKHTNIIIRKG